MAQPTYTIRYPLSHDWASMGMIRSDHYSYRPYDYVLLANIITINSGRHSSCQKVQPEKIAYYIYFKVLYIFLHLTLKNK